MAQNKPLIENLKVILNKDVPSDIVSYIQSINLIEDYEEFMENIIDRNNPSHLNSYENIKDIIFRTSTSSANSKKSPSIKLNNSRQNNTPGPLQKKGRAKFHDFNKYEVKKKQTGRTICDCLGQEHEFLNNCLQCGRIHCMEEGPGPCLFCGNTVSTKDKDSYSNSRKQKTAMKPKQNKVFDDDNDYFKVNSKVKTSKGDKDKMVIALDFASRRIIESTQEDNKIREKLLQESVVHLKKADETYKSLQKQSELSYSRKLNQNVNEDLIDLLIQMRHKKAVGVEDLGVEDDVMPIIDYGMRVFDEDMMMNTDQGLCLSMHQPHASLLVAGVKRHEGRTWPTMHRGRLWIAAAAKEPEEEEVEGVEKFYKEYYEETTLKFPKEYPISCLLGSVFIEDCMNQEAYRKKYPNGESNSPFVLICSNPIILPIFYPILGKHKIYPLDKELHKCAKLALQHAKYIV